MTVTQLNTFADVQRFIDQILTQNDEAGGVGFSPHKAFWRNLTYDNFVNGNVPGVTEPQTGAPLPILVKGNSDQSNLILALRGTAPLFSPNAFGQMPANGPPFFSKDDIDSIAAWIDADCPEFQRGPGGSPGS
jgi:hypothetical protein